MEQKFYTSGESKAVLAVLSGNASGEIKELIAGTTDAAVEKHVPVCELADGKLSVKVGSVEHPMTEAHLIEWVAVKTNKGLYTKFLKAGEAPAACFNIDSEEKLEAVYAYCNLHGLWKAE